MSKWQKVFADASPHRAGIIKALLEDRGIQAVMIDKRNEAFNNFGHHEVYVTHEHVIRALKIIDDDNSFE